MVGRRCLHVRSVAIGIRFITGTNLLREHMRSLVAVILYPAVDLQNTPGLYLGCYSLGYCTPGCNSLGSGENRQEVRLRCCCRDMAVRHQCIVRDRDLVVVCQPPSQCPDKDFDQDDGGDVQ